MPTLNLTLLADTLAICRLPSDAPVPSWAYTGVFSSVSRTPDELSIVCAENAVKDDVLREGDWRALKLEGPFDLAQTGILVQVLAPLGEAAINIFAISTYDTDYVLIKSGKLDHAIAVLRAAGHHINL